MRNAGDGGGHVYGMGIVVRPDRLRFELSRRGWSASDLARESGVSGPTVSAALAGRPIAPQSLRLMASALGRVPVVPTIDALIQAQLADVKGVL